MVAQAIVLSALVAAAICNAAPGAGDRLQADLKRTLTERVEEALQPQEVAKQLHIAYPIRLCDKTIVEMKLLTHKEVQHRLASGVVKKPDYDALAEERYPLFERGQSIEVPQKRGYAVRGVLHSVAPTYIQVGRLRISKVDLTEDALSMIDPLLNREKRARFIRNRKLLYQDQLREAKTTLIRDVEQELYPKHGYALVGNRWRPASERFEKALDKRRAQLRKELRTDVENDVYPRHGYTRSGGKWVYRPRTPVSSEPALFQEPGTSVSTRPETPEKGPAPPPPPADRGRARDAVLDALKKQGAVENVPE